MSHARRAVACCGALAVSLLFLSSSARAADPAVTNAIIYLHSQQIAGTDPKTGSGAWDMDPATQFDTGETVLAIAESAQTGTSWSTAEALAAVQATTNVKGFDPTGFIDLWESAVTDKGAGAGAAAKFVVLAAAPLGRDTSALATKIDNGANPDGSYGTDQFLNNTLYAALAKDLLDGSVPGGTVSYIESKQKPSDGGWSYDSDTGTVTPADVDTTGLALQALIAGGVSPTDPIVQRGLAFIAGQQNADGTWSAFGDESAESTSRALLAVTAAGYDPDSRCWRDTVLPSSSSQPFVAGDPALESLANPDGSIAGPNTYDVTYATAQAVQGLERTWLPIVRAAPQSCSTPVAPSVAVEPTVAVEATAATAVLVAPAFTG